MPNESVHSNSISVVIPVFNEQKNIKECLTALLPQLSEKDEVIIVDNNSTDESVAIIKGFHNPQVRIIYETKQGITHARTCGFNAAKNPIIARIDADTVVSHNWLSIVRQKLSNDTSVNALCGAVAIKELSPRGRFWFQWGTRIFRAWHERSLQVKPIMYGHNSALTKSLWQNINSKMDLGDSSISEDLDITLACIVYGKVKYEPTLLVKSCVLRTMSSIEKLHRYYITDGYTLNKYQIGNKKRWSSAQTTRKT